MTTISHDSVTCAKCSSSVAVTLMGSTNAFGSMDLDMRPPPMARDTLGLQIQQCEICGFCAPDIADSEGVDLAEVDLPAYASVLADDRFPPLARRFRAYGLASRGAGSHAASCWAALRAAWVCDDGGPGHQDTAIFCRQEALQAIALVHADGKTFCPDRQTDEILRLDLLRRLGDFRATIEAADRLRGNDLPDILKRIADFQAKQAERGVSACFTVAEAIED